MAIVNDYRTRLAGVLAGTALLWAGQAQAGLFAPIEEDLDKLPFSISGDVGAVSKYVFRAQSDLGNGGASVQGSLNVSPDFLPQFTTGIWYSTIDGTSGGDEIDFIGDFTFDVGGISLSAGAVAYTFIDFSDGTAVDLYGGAGVGPVSTTLYYTVSGDDLDPDAHVLSDEDIWWEIGTDLPSIKTITPSITAQLSQYGDESTNDDFDLQAVVFSLSKDIGDLISMSINYSKGIGDDRGGAALDDEFWAGFFVNF